MVTKHDFKYIIQKLHNNIFYIIPFAMILTGIFVILIFALGDDQTKVTTIDQTIAETLYHVKERNLQEISPMFRGEIRNYTQVNNKLVPILMYHHIRDYVGKDKIEASLSTTPTDFAKQLAWLKDNNFHTITFSDLFSGKVEDKSIILTFDDGYRDNYETAYKKLKNNGQKGNFFVFSGAISASETFMTAEMIKEMSDYGMEFGSHTIDHIDMSVASKEKLDTQLTVSKARLEEITGKKVEILCYPSGQYSPLAEAETKAAGYKAAVTTRPYANSSNLYEIPRIRMNPGTSPAGLSASITAYLSASDRYDWIF